MKRILRTRLAALALSLACASCVLGPTARMAPHVAEGAYCASPHVLSPPAARTPPDAENASAQEATARGYSLRSLDTARAIGALAVIERLCAAQARKAPEAEITDIRGEVHGAIAAAALDLSSTVAHIQCEEGRAAQIASDLRDAEQAQTRRLTAYSLIVSALATIGTGVFAIADKDPVPAGVVGITGGVVGGALGLATLEVKRTATFMHARNVLGELWTAREHPDFPEAVWTYLTRARFTIRGDISVRDYLMRDWKKSGRLGDDAEHPSPERVALYFGDGGLYDADGLDDRADMLSDVREAVGLMFHELQHLETEAARH
jgi:hypothetical protein